jgi:hypothetical protein
MSDAVLKIAVIVDKEGITDGLEAGKETVSAATVDMAASFEKLQSRATGAWKKISEDTKSAMSSVSAESLKVAEATKVLSRAFGQQRAATNLAKLETVDAVESLKALAAAQDITRAATVALAVTQAELGGTMHKSVTDIQATSGAIRGLEGNPGIRAMENFVGKTLGLGPLMQKFFPLVGATAFFAIITEGAEKFEEMREKALNAGAAIAEAFAEIHDKAQQSIDTTTIQNDKLRDQLDILSGHRNNGLATALDEARKAADELLLSLKEDGKALKGILEGNAVNVWAEVFTNQSHTGKQATEMLGDQKKLLEDIRGLDQQGIDKKAATDDPGEQKRIGDATNKAIRARIQAEIDTYKREVTRLATEESQANMEAMSGVRGAQTVDNSAKIANAAGYISQLQDRQKRVSLDADQTDLQAKVGAAKQDKGDAGADNKAAEQQLRNIETKFAEMNTKLPEEALAFWRRYVGTFKDGSAEYLHVVEQMNRYTSEFAKGLSLSTKLKEELKRSEKDNDSGKQDEIAEGMAKVQAAAKKQGEDVWRTGERWDGYNKAIAAGQEMASKIQATLAEGALRIRESTGGITGLAASQKLASIHTQEHIDRLKELEKELAKLKEDGANLKPGDKGYEENATKQQGAQNAITQEKGSGQVQGQQDQAAIAAATAKPYLTAFDQINNGWLKVQNDLIAGQGRIGQNFAHMGVSMVQSMAANFEKMLVSQLQMELRSVAAHTVAQAQKTTTDAAGAALSTQINKKSNLQQVFGDAKTAAAGAYKAMAGIPIIGPVLGGVAAGATFAAVMSLAAFEQGGIVGGSPGMAVPILAHSGERVLSNSQTNNFERMVNNNSSGGDMHLHMGGNHYHGSSSSDIRAAGAQNDRQTVKTITRLHREGKLKLA